MHLHAGGTWTLVHLHAGGTWTLVHLHAGGAWKHVYMACICGNEGHEMLKFYKHPNVSRECAEVVLTGSSPGGAELCAEHTGKTRPVQV